MNATATASPDSPVVGSLAGQIAHAAAVYAQAAAAVRAHPDLAAVRTEVTWSATFEYLGVRFEAYLRTGVLHLDVPDPDVAAKIAAIAGAQRDARNSSSTLHLWRGRALDMPLVIIGRGQPAAAMTDAVLLRILRDIDQVVGLDVTA